MYRVAQLVSPMGLGRSAALVSGSMMCSPAMVSGARFMSVQGRVTNEDRRWWLVHLECSPDVAPTTFAAWLDCCGEHTMKKLVERNIWTIEQVAGLTSDQIDELRFAEGCVKMDIVWEHARTILTPLRTRNTTGGVESELQNRVLQLRKQRELEKQRANILQERANTAAGREDTMAKLKDAIAAKKEALRKMQMDKLKRQQQRQEYEAGVAGGATSEAEETVGSTSVRDTVSDVAEELSKKDTPKN
jgi:hypothetical protein